MNIKSGCKISTKSHLDKTNPRGIFIGKNTVITPGVYVLSHNYIRGNNSFVDTRIGDNVFIGVNSIILPGVTITNNVIVGAGSIVTNDIIESYCIVAGNPARIIKRNVNIIENGQIESL